MSMDFETMEFREWFRECSGRLGLTMREDEARLVWMEAQRRLKDAVTNAMSYRTSEAPTLRSYPAEVSSSLSWADDQIAVYEKDLGQISSYLDALRRYRRTLVPEPCQGWGSVEQFLNACDKCGDPRLRERLEAKHMVGYLHIEDGVAVVAGWLDLNDCKSLTHLPEGLKVGEALSLWNCTSLIRLPRGLEVGGYLWLRRCTSWDRIIPEGVTIGDRIYTDGHPYRVAFDGQEQRGSGITLAEWRELYGFGPGK